MVPFIYLFFWSFLRSFRRSKCRFFRIEEKRRGSHHRHGREDRLGEKNLKLLQRYQKSDVVKDTFSVLSIFLLKVLLSEIEISLERKRTRRDMK